MVDEDNVDPTFSYVINQEVERLVKGRRKTHINSFINAEPFNITDENFLANLNKKDMKRIADCRERPKKNEKNAWADGGWSQRSKWGVTVRREEEHIMICMFDIYDICVFEQIAETTILQNNVIVACNFNFFLNYC